MQDTWSNQQGREYLKWETGSKHLTSGDVVLFLAVLHTREQERGETTGVSGYCSQSAAPEGLAPAQGLSNRDSAEF